MQSDSFSQAEYTLLRAEPRPLSEAELALLRAEIRRHLRTGWLLIVASVLGFWAFIITTSSVENGNTSHSPALVAVCLLALFLLNSGYWLVRWAGMLRGDCKSGQVLRFTLPGASETLEILGNSGRVWRWEGGPSIPEFGASGFHRPAVIRCASEVGVRHIPRAEFAARGWRELPKRLIAYAVVGLWFLIAFDPWLLGHQVHAHLGIFSAIPTWLLLGILSLAVDITGRISLLGWQRRIAFRRDLAEGVALCFHGEYRPEGSQYPTRPIWREVLLHSGRRWRMKIGPSSYPLLDLPAEPAT